MPKYDVAGLGNAIMDVIAAVDDQFLLDHGIAKGGMTLIDEFRAEELHRALSGSVQVAGGSAANTMAGIASLGGRAMFLGKVCDDALGGSDRTTLAAFLDSVDRWMSDQLRVAPANADLAQLARLAEVWEKINRTARDVESFNLDRKPLVFSVFDLLSEATR